MSKNYKVRCYDRINKMLMISCNRSFRCPKKKYRSPSNNPNTCILRSCNTGSQVTRKFRFINPKCNPPIQLELAQTPTSKCDYSSRVSTAYAHFKSNLQRIVRKSSPKLDQVRKTQESCLMNKSLKCRTAKLNKNCVNMQRNKWKVERSDDISYKLKHFIGAKIRKMNTSNEVNSSAKRRPIPLRLYNSSIESSREASYINHKKSACSTLLFNECIKEAFDSKTKVKSKFSSGIKFYEKVPVNIDVSEKSSVGKMKIVCCLESKGKCCEDDTICFKDSLFIDNYNFIV